MKCFAHLAVVDLSALHERMHTVVGSLSYRVLADATDLHPETVRRYMRGQAPSAEFLSALCFKFDVNAQWLLTGQGPIRHAETRAHALRNANPSDLLTGIGASLERLNDRVSRIEILVQALEARTRDCCQAAAVGEPKEAQLRESKAQVDPDQKNPDGGICGNRAADTLAKRSQEPFTRSRDRQ